MRSDIFRQMECPVAQSVSKVGGAWRVLVLRDALAGFRRSDDFRRSLEIAAKFLTQCRTALVGWGSRWLSSEGTTVTLVSAETGRPFARVFNGELPPPTLARMVGPTIVAAETSCTLLRPGVA